MRVGINLGVAEGITVAAGIRVAGGVAVGFTFPLQADKSKKHKPKIIFFSIFSSHGLSIPGIDAPAHQKLRRRRYESPPDF
jgi:hypothetical protein